MRKFKSYCYSLPDRHPQLILLFKALISIGVFYILFRWQHHWFRYHCPADLLSLPKCSTFKYRLYGLSTLVSLAVFAMLLKPRLLGNLGLRLLNAIRTASQSYHWFTPETGGGFRKTLCFLGIVTGIVIFFIKFGWPVLDPTNIYWIVNTEDPAQAYLGWSLFRESPWRFPLGAMPELMYPVGSNAGFTDPVMLLALVFKALSPWLPFEFQYFGIWYLFCYIMQGAAAGLLMSTLTSSLLGRTLATIFLTISPILLFRWGHITLCAHFLILFSLYLNINQGISCKLRIGLHAFLVVISALLHPYLTFMMIVLFGALLLNSFFRREISSKQAVVYLFGIGISCLLAWWMLGYIGWLDLGPPPEFGSYGLNLLAFFNPLGFSRWLPAIPLFDWKQYEGFAYLGLGGLILLFGWLVEVWKDRHSQQRRIGFWHPTTIACGLLAILGIGYHPAVGPFGFSIAPLTNLLTPVLGQFQSSGRFIWPLYYLLTYVLLRYAMKRKERLGIPAAISLGLIILIQIADLSPLLSPIQILPSNKFQLSSQAEWEHLLENKEKLLFFPPFQMDYLTKSDYTLFWNLARGRSLRLNFGYVARFNLEKAKQLKEEMAQSIEQGRKELRSLYVTTNEYITLFQRPQSTWQCRPLDNYWVCE